MYCSATSELLILLSNWVEDSLVCRDAARKSTHPAWGVSATWKLAASWTCSGTGLLPAASPPSVRERLTWFFCLTQLAVLMCSGVGELRGCKAGSPAGGSLLCASVPLSVFWFQLNPFLDAEKTNCRTGFFFSP